jgi:hypothetical protein
MEVVPIPAELKIQKIKISAGIRSALHIKGAALRLENHGHFLLT